MRPRLAAVPRTPSGRTSKRHQQATRAMIEREVIAVACDARQRLFGVSPAQSTDPALSTVLGRLWRSNRLSDRQHEAGEAYLKMRRDYDALMGIPHLACGSNVQRTRGHDSRTVTAAYVEWERRVRRQHADCLAALMACDRHALPAIELTVIEDRHPAHLIASLRTALNAVAKVLL